MRPALLVSVSKGKTWKTQTLNTCCVTPKSCLYLYFEPLLFIHTKAIYNYNYSYFVCVDVYTYIYIYIYIYIYTYIYIYIYSIHDTLEWMFYVGVPLSIFYKILSKFTQPPCCLSHVIASKIIVLLSRVVYCLIRNILHSNYDYLHSLLLFSLLLFLF